jgi:sirohydrochlorin cobaltochelatase
MNHPIVITAFGTTTRARTTYARVNEKLRHRFPGHEIHWAYTSRIVRHKLKRQSVDMPPPLEVLTKIASQGHKWAVVQSFNMICGHEFHRLKEEVLNGPLRVSIGHSLLCSPEDLSAVADLAGSFFTEDDDTAVVLVGHGTDHCSWSVYPAFEQLLRQRYGNRSFVGVIEGDWPVRESVVENVQSAGFKRVRLVPLMLVAGIHAQEDLAGPEDSWKAAFEARGITVSIEPEGLGAHPRIIDIFGNHIQSALDVIPRDNSSYPQTLETG